MAALAFKSKILLVDDEPATLRLLERIMQIVGPVEVRSTTDSRQFLALFKEFDPDLVVSDLHMPHFDGFDVLDQIRAVTPAEIYLPVLVLTADGSAETKRRALSAGAKDFLTKPLDHSEVVLRIQNLLETRHLHRQLREQNALLQQRLREQTAAVPMSS